MASVNKVILVGNLGNDPELRKLPSGESVANLSLATTDRYRDRQTGENKELTEWHRINMFGKLADIAGQYLRKGSQVYIEGSIRTRKWQDQSGQTRYSTEIRADSMQMLGSKTDSAGYSANQTPTAPATQAHSQQFAPTEAPKPTAPQEQSQSVDNFFGDLDNDVPF